MSIHPCKMCENPICSTNEVLYFDCLFNNFRHYVPNKNKLNDHPFYKHEVVTLCGSTKFKDDFILAQEMLTLRECIVISVGIFGHADNVKMTQEVKEMLDEVHKRKIDMCDTIVVVNRNNYIGQSTLSEIMYAKEHGKRILYMF